MMMDDLFEILKTFRIQKFEKSYFDFSACTRTELENFMKKARMLGLDHIPEFHGPVSMARSANSRLGIFFPDETPPQEFLECGWYLITTMDHLASQSAREIRLTADLPDEFWRSYFDGRQAPVLVYNEGSIPFSWRKGGFVLHNDTYGFLLQSIHLGEKPGRTIDENEGFFEEHADKINFFDEKVREILAKIDGVVYQGHFMVSPVSDPAEEFSIQKLSAGCKTALNIYTFKDLTFNIAECGDTAIEVILNLDRGHLYLPHSIPLPRFLPQKAVYTDGEMRIVKDADQLRNILYLNF